MGNCKVIELIGVSEKSWDDAAKNAVSDACKSLKNVSGIKVLNQTAKIQEGSIIKYKVDLKVVFEVER